MMERNQDTFVLSLRGLLFVEYLNDGLTADQADAAVVALLKRCRIPEEAACKITAK